MRLFKRSKPKIEVHSTEKDGYSGWLKCTDCGEMIHRDEMEKSCHCCPKCNYHYQLAVQDRVALLADKDSFVELFDEVAPVDALKFVDSKPYADRIQAAQKKTGRTDAALVGSCTMGGNQVALGVLDFQYMGGSMGSVVGEKLTLLMEYALENQAPLVIVSASGGARMQESILSLMQMGKTSAALSKLHEAKIPYISILTNPTTGGVTASFASLGDIIIAEPKALIGFAGPRVIEQTIGRQLPEGAQLSEFLLEHGMIDAIVSRQEMKEKVIECIEMLKLSA